MIILFFAIVLGTLTILVFLMDGIHVLTHLLFNDCSSRFTDWLYWFLPISFIILSIIGLCEL